MDNDHLYTFSILLKQIAPQEENWPRGFRGEVVDGQRMDNDGRQVITISYPEPSAQERLKGKFTMSNSKVPHLS